MDEPCQICGDIGVVDIIIACSVCKNTREHVYCMRNYDGVVPSVWTCEACELSKEMVSLRSGVNSSCILHHGTKDSAGLNKFPNNSGRGRVSWEKRVDKGKTKYLSAQEAISLSSGTKQFGSPITNLTLSPPKTKATMSGQTPLKPNAVPPKLSLVTVKANPSFGSSGHSRPPRQQQGLAQASKELKENNAYPACMKKHAHMQLPLKAINKPVEEIGTANRQVEKAMGNVSCSSSGSLPCPPKTVSGDNVWSNEKHGDSVAENRNVMNILPQVDKTLPSDPALYPSWKGTFKLPKSLSWVECNDEVRAHPRSRVRRKAYEFLKKMPEALEFKIFRRHDIWMDVFQDDCPDNEDIGLYFFPSDDRNENYISLLECLSRQDLVMRSYINGVELFVFASILLRKDFQKWNGNDFLWGVFRCVKTADARRKDIEEVILSGCPSIGGDDSDYVDMEIDMLGGSNVGKVDVVISKKPIRENNENCIVETATRESSSFNVAEKMCSNIPPGFENCISSSSGTQKCKYSESPGQLEKRRQAVDPTSASLSPKSAKRTGFVSPADETSGQTKGAFRTPISSKLAASSRDNRSSDQEKTLLKVKTEII
ncbi:hypothetical protein LguiB_007966 [Lonicera macranthoides]